MNALSAISVPDDPGPFKRAEDRWKPYVDDPAAASLFAGSALTHSDWAPDNVLVAPGRAWLIDWAWPTLGAAWTDPACWILRLMASGGHTAPEAERQAFRLPAFQAADPAHVDLFAAANVRLWDEIAQLSTTAWTGKMAKPRTPGPRTVRLARRIRVTSPSTVDLCALQPAWPATGTGSLGKSRYAAVPGDASAAATQRWGEVRRQANLSLLTVSPGVGPR
jgi:hypothetical protein